MFIGIRKLHADGNNLYIWRVSTLYSQWFGRQSSKKTAPILKKKIATYLY